MEKRIREVTHDVVAMSGDFSQRARAGEFQRAAVFVREAARHARTICVPGNHDVAWWKTPLGLGDREQLTANYRHYLHPEIEPVLRVPGATFVGLNTAQGVLPQTLTWNVRDISIIGHLTRSQVDRAARAFADSPTEDARVIVMHHNPVKGELSQRHGLKNTRKVLGAFAEIGVDLVLCGHDHQEAIHMVEHTKKGTVVSTAGTVSNRSRGGRPSSCNEITITPDAIAITTLVWSGDAADFVPGPSYRFAR